MKRRRGIASTGMAVLVAAVAAACGSSSTSPTPVPGGGNPQPSTPPKIGWSQRASTLAQATTYSYGVYVDGKTRVSFGSVSCVAGTVDGTFDCSSNFPQMEAGQHSLELVAIDPSGLESPRSAPPLSVTVASSGTISFDAK